MNTIFLLVFLTSLLWLSLYLISLTHKKSWGRKKINKPLILALSISSLLFLSSFFLTIPRNEILKDDNSQEVIGFSDNNISDVQPLEDQNLQSATPQEKPNDNGSNHTNPNLPSQPSSPAIENQGDRPADSSNQHIHHKNQILISDYFPIKNQLSYIIKEEQTTSNGINIINHWIRYEDSKNVNDKEVFAISTITYGDKIFPGDDNETKKNYSLYTIDSEGTIYLEGEGRLNNPKWFDIKIPKYLYRTELEKEYVLYDINGSKEIIKCTLLNEEIIIGELRFKDVLIIERNQITTNTNDKRTKIMSLEYYGKDIGLIKKETEITIEDKTKNESTTNYILSYISKLGSPDFEKNPIETMLPLNIQLKEVENQFRAIGFSVEEKIDPLFNKPYTLIEKRDLNIKISLYRIDNSIRKIEASALVGFNFDESKLTDVLEEHLKILYGQDQSREIMDWLFSPCLSLIHI